jgi:LuxR family transcriptional regulator, maltose regulon positive regulatory protein
VSWIAAPAGFGKTSLLVSYIETRKIQSLWYRVDEGDSDAADLFFYMRSALEVFERSRRAGAELPSFSAKADVGTFSRRFFEAYFARLPAGAMLVLDDYHLAPDSSSWQEAVEKIVANVPPRMNVVVLSRLSPPPWLARPRIHGDIGLLERAELQLTEGEVAALARRRRTGAKRRDALTDLKAVYIATGGWAAGVSLLLHRSGPAAVPDRLAGPEMQPIFDYLASAVFSELGVDAQRLMLSTVALPSFTAAQAALLSGVARADEELRHLYRSGLFLECDDAGSGVYHFHSLFRTFLAYRSAQALGPAESRAVRTRAAHMLRADGRDEEAFELFLDIGEVQAATELVLARAATLFSEGRGTLLDRRIAALPAAVTGASEWLTYWQAMCALMGTPAKSRVAFECALAGFIDKRDGAGAYLAWAGAVHAHTYEARTWRGIERWLDRLTEIEQFCPTFPSADVGGQVLSALLMGLTLAGAEASTLEAWAARALALAENTNDPTVRVMTASVLLLHYALYGDSGRGVAFVAQLAERADDGEAGFLARVAAKGATAALAWHRGNLAEGLAAALEGIALMGDRPVPMWQSALLVFGSLTALDKGDLVQVGRFLTRLRTIAEMGSPLDVSAYQAIRARHAMARGELSGALGAIELSLDAAEAVGFSWGQACCLLITTYLAFELGQFDRARAAHVALRNLEEASRDPVLAYWRLLLEADQALRQGDRPSAVGLVKRAFQLGRERQLFASQCPSPERLAGLCRLALLEGIEADYARTLVRRRGLLATQPPMDVPDWPWPIRICVLGGLQVSIDGVPISLGRAWMTPLLLRTIVALGPEFGSRGIPMRRLVAALWTDAEDDTAHHAFEMSLSRLRKQLGPLGQRAIRLENDRVHLDRSICWTDFDAMGALLKEIANLDAVAASGPAGDADAVRALSRRLLALMSGPLSDGDALPNALLPIDERLSARVSAAILDLGRRHEARAEPEVAEALYLKALDSDPRMAALLVPRKRFSERT